jgi:pimeloyl-ACP methyl ester carboxylesterase
MRALIAVLIALLCFGSPAFADEPVLLSDPSKVDDADRALVFIHGILGSPTESFGNWPAIIAADNTQFPDHGKLSDIAVYAVDYQAHFTSQSTLEEVAVGIAAELGASQIFKKHRHVWLVAHSMGGLVLKQALISWKLAGKNVLLDRIQGIGMLGVPSGGAPLADLAQSLQADKIAKLLGWNGELVKDLTTDSGKRYLSALEDGWASVKTAFGQSSIRRYTPVIECGVETKPESRFAYIVSAEKYGTIVPKLYASSACNHTTSFPYSHIELIKPANSRSQVHSWLRELIIGSATEGLKEQWTQLTADPAVPSYLATRADYMNKDVEPVNFEPGSRLPLQPEKIEFDDDQSREAAEHLMLRGSSFVANTKSALFEAVAKKNSCIKAKISPNRLLITLSVHGQTKSCGNGTDLVCVNQSCN